MTVEREIPDSHVMSLADQFCDAADLLFKATHSLSAPHALRVNAVFAIELYIKSLKCRWVCHNQLEILGVDCDAITTESDIRGHKLHLLFDGLDEDAQRFLINAFASHSLNEKYPGLRPILAEYSDNFVSDRYVFERLKDDQPHPISEIIQLAIFFRQTLNSMTRVRT